MQCLQDSAQSDACNEHDDFVMPDAPHSPCETRDVVVPRFSQKANRISREVSKRIVEQVMNGENVAGNDAIDVVRGSEAHREAVSVADFSEAPGTNKNSSTQMVEAAPGNDTSILHTDEIEPKNASEMLAVNDALLESGIRDEAVSNKITKGRKPSTPESKRMSRKELKQKNSFEVASLSPDCESAISISSSITDVGLQVAASDKDPSGVSFSNDINKNDSIALDSGEAENQKDLLCARSGAPNSEGIQPIRTVRLHQQLLKHLKPHQLEGVKFMWRNSFSDFAYYQKGRPDQSGGCILAHYMGLVSAFYLWFSA
jgi:hypothetical protein